jgi:hypothetical protein
LSIDQILGLFKPFGVEQSANLNVVFNEISNTLSIVPEYKPDLINIEVDSHAAYINNS